MTREVIEAMWPYLTDNFGNASSHHDAGRSALEALEVARTTVATVLNCRPDEIVFTSGGTESNNYAIKGIALARPKGRHVVTSAIEHEAVLEPIHYLERFHDFHTTSIPVDENGLVDLQLLRAALTDQTTLCTIQYANSEIGTVQSLAAIAAVCKQAGVPFHTDAVQAAGDLNLDVQALGVDMLSMSAHKFGGPKGIGALFVRNGLALEPLLHGGGQESGARSGTSNVAGAVGLATALSRSVGAESSLAGASAHRSGSLGQSVRDQFIDEVLVALPNARLTGHRSQRLTNHASFTLGTISGESIVVELALRGISCSSGSACAEGEDEPSPVLLALGISAEIAQTAVRFTLGPTATKEDLRAVLPQLVSAANGF